MSGNRSKSPFFRSGWVTLSVYLTGKLASPTNHSWCQKTRVIAVSCDIKVSAVHDSPSYSFVTIHASDGQTDRTATAIPCVALHVVAR